MADHHTNCFGRVSRSLLVYSYQTSCLKLAQLEETPGEMASCELADCTLVGREFAADATAGRARPRRVRIRSPLTGKV